MSARAVVAVAGMEGALASVVGGLVDCPVIAVPTSVGYGASFGGLSALLSMLNACASGISVVNIDNGFGAGYQAHMIERAGSQHGEGEPDMKTLRWNLAENATRNQLWAIPCCSCRPILASVLRRRPMPQASPIAIITISGRFLPPSTAWRFRRRCATICAPSTPSWPKRGCRARLRGRANPLP